MIFNISHTIGYHYSRPVFLEPQLLRLTPWNDVNQRLQSFTRFVTPTPSGSHDFLDTENNPACWLWFDGEHETLEITTNSVTETLNDNPFTFIITDDSFRRWPPKYSELEALSLQTSPTAISGRLATLREALVKQADRSVMGFLANLNQTLHKEIKVEVRDQGEPQRPEDTWQQKRGACRDLAVLFIELCRGVGLAARFVSGYQEGDPKGPHYLHAWAEVYIPGAGWLGFDPVAGLIVADRHIVLARSYHYAGAAALSGSFRGTAKAQLHYSITLRISPQSQNLVD